MKTHRLTADELREYREYATVKLAETVEARTRLKIQGMEGPIPEMAFAIVALCDHIDAISKSEPCKAETKGAGSRASGGG